MGAKATMYCCDKLKAFFKLENDPIFINCNAPYC